MSTLRAGNLRHKIDIWQQKEIQDPNNGSISHRWVLAFERVSAGVNPVSAREFIAAQASQYQYDVRITIRYNPQIDNRLNGVQFDGFRIFFFIKRHLREALYK